MGVAERKIRHKEQVRGAILQSAWKIATEEGWQTLSIRKIADAIEYSVPVIYSHFENKEAILLEFTKEGFTLLTQELLKAKENEQGPGCQLVKMARAYWNFAFENKEYYQLMFGLGMPACEMVNTVPEMKTFTEVMVSSISAAIAQSKNPEAEVFMKYHAYWSILHGLVAIQMIEKSVYPDDLKQKVLQDAIEGFVRGIDG